LGRHPRYLTLRHSRESGNPASFELTTLGPRFRGDDDCGAIPVPLAGRDHF
jgi:hypothetical protein